MAWRGVHLTKASRLTHADGQIVVSQADGEVRLPIEDVAWLVIDSPQVTLTTALVSACMEVGTVLITTDSRHTPNGMILPFHRHYWERLFPDFVRERAGDKRNMMLNYGYAVVRAAVARGLVAAGLLPALGINHASAANAFNLADDLVEPFRPFVDDLVWRLSDGGRSREGEPSVDERQKLAAVLLEDARIGAETVSLLVASEMAAASLVRALEAHSAALLRLPRVVAEAE
jgi:CRISPR/Cas system-associated endonuclease Cas1